MTATADALYALGMPALGYRYTTLSDCVFVGRNGGGYLLANATAFPSGMAALATYISTPPTPPPPNGPSYLRAEGRSGGSGGRVGPGPAVGASALIPGVSTSAGRLTCSGRGPGSMGYELQDATSFVGWGFGAVEVDNCNGEGERGGEVRLAVRSGRYIGRAIVGSVIASASDCPLAYTY